ncbi:MAG: DUF1453 domain-containing protein [Rhodanobacteraceae bacterium]
MTPTAHAPILVVPLILFAIYRRVRRNFGRQPVRPGRMKTRIVLFAVIGLLVLLPAFLSPRLAGAAAIGLLAGAFLAVAGLHLTHFETDPDGHRWYTPHGYIGVAISLVLLGRLLYRFLVIYPTLQAGARAGGAYPIAAYQRSPLTLALLAAVVAYYVVYLVGVLLRSARTSTSPTIGS